MNPLVERFRIVERELATDRGYFSFFALVKNSSLETLWDVVVAAPWLSVDELAGLREVAEKLQTELEPLELQQISGVAVLKDDSPLIQATRRLISISSGCAHLEGNIVAGVILPEMFVITSALDKASQLKA